MFKKFTDHFQLYWADYLFIVALSFLIFVIPVEKYITNLSIIEKSMKCSKRGGTLVTSHNHNGAGKDVKFCYINRSLELIEEVEIEVN